MTFRTKVTRAQLTFATKKEATYEDKAPRFQVHMLNQKHNLNITLSRKIQPPESNSDFDGNHGDDVAENERV